MRAIEELKQLNPGRPLNEQDLPLLVVMRNARFRLPDFFRHYRNIGISRFIVIDNESDDDSVDFLMQQSDADVWEWRQEYSSRRQIAVCSRLAQFYGLKRWYLFADIDEYFVYSGMDRYGLKDLANALEIVGEYRVNAPIVDMCSIRPQSEISFDDSTRLLDVCDHFDSRGYKYSYKRWGLHVSGGPRNRLFKSENNVAHLLSKAPFFYFGEDTHIITTHNLAPYDQGALWPRAATLHFKFVVDVARRIEEEVSRNRHWKNALAYKIYQENLHLLEGGLPLDNVLKRYKGPESLLEAGLMGTPPWASLPA